MTNRIRELAEQAGEEVVSEVFEEYMITETSDGAELKVPAIFIEKFAELIVRECADVAKQSEPDDGDDYKSGRQWAGIEILKHFNVGVEE